MFDAMGEIMEAQDRKKDAEIARLSAEIERLTKGSAKLFLKLTQQRDSLLSENKRQKDTIDHLQRCIETLREGPNKYIGDRCGLDRMIEDACSEMLSIIRNSTLKGQSDE